MSREGPAPAGFRHRGWGLTWAMPLEFPELARAPEGAAVDVRVQDGPVPLGPRCAGGADFLFQLPGIARILVRSGREVQVERLGGASEEDRLRLLLLGTGAALVLHQRGLLPLHASGVVGPRGAILCLGHSGAGKSTLLAELVRRGYPMLSEDLAAVRLAADGSAWVEPGVRSTRLWADSLRALQVPAEGLARVRPELDKFLLPAASGQVAGEAAPLCALYALSTHNGSEVLLEEFEGARKFNALIEQTWMKAAVRRMGLEAEHFRRAAAVAGGVRGMRARRPQGRFRLAELADALEADLHR